LLLGHGTGRTNTSQHGVSYAEKHRKDVAARVVINVRVDIDHLDDAEVLRLAQCCFTGPPGEILGAVAAASQALRGHQKMASRP
jgi:hypothetical protein